MLKRLWKNEKGLTLIELLAVVVILGIIAAIAVPSIGGIIDNTKRDAHIANAQQMVSATKLYVAANNITVSKGTTTNGNTTNNEKTIKLSDLITSNYMDNIKDPSGMDGTTDKTKYNTTDSVVKIINNGTSGYQYKVTLKGSNDTVYINDKDIVTVKRDEVILP